MKSLRRRQGFTMIEALIVACLFAMLGLTLVSAFSTGMKVWKRAAGLVVNERQSIVGLERLSLELRRLPSVAFSVFNGTETQCTFLNVLSEGRQNISYWYEPEEKKLYRSAAMEGAEENASVRSLVNGVETFNLSYFGFNPKTLGLEFMDTWTNRTGVPKMVKAVLKVKDAEFEKTILVPAGQ